MQTRAGRTFPLNTDSAVPEIFSDLCTLFVPDLTHGDLVFGNEAIGVTNFDMNSWSSTVADSMVNAIQSETSESALNLVVNQEAELQDLMDQMDQPEEYHGNYDLANRMHTVLAPSASPGPQPPLPPPPSTNSETVPIIRARHQSYRCTWYPHDSGIQCDHVAPDRRAFLHHLGATHQVSGESDVLVVCRLLDSKMGSACQAPIKRGNFPRHVDTHYPLRYHCQYCPAGTSFSRQDTWKRHMRTKHTETPSTS